MFNLFKRKNPSTDVSQTVSTDGLYHQVFSRKRMPSPGSPAYAWETLGLVLFSPIGPGISTRDPRTTLGKASLFQKAVQVDGLPTVTGSLVTAPLVNPDSAGYGRGISDFGLNDPFPQGLTSAAGTSL